MDTFRKWLNKPKADDKSLLARFYHADRALTAVASELDSFDGRAEPDRCSRLVSRLRQGQDKVLSITNRIMEELLGDDRAPRAFRAKFPEEVLQENLAGQLWFGAECLAAGSSIMNREFESTSMRPLAQAVTKSLDNVRNLLRDQCLRNNIPNSPTLKLDINDSTTEQLYESLKIFDRLFAEFELRYVSAMVQVKSKQEYEMQELICVLFSETLQRALQIHLLEQDQVDSFDPALMFSIPRLAIVTGLIIFNKGPLNMDMPADQLSEMFRPFRTILIKIRDLLKTLNKNELYQLEKLLCTNEEIHLKQINGSNNNNNNNNNNNSSLNNSQSDQQNSQSLACTENTIENQNKIAIKDEIPIIERRNSKLSEKLKQQKEKDRQRENEIENDKKINSDVVNGENPKLNDCDQDLVSTNSNNVLGNSQQIINKTSTSTTISRQIKYNEIISRTNHKSGKSNSRHVSASKFSKLQLNQENNNDNCNIISTSPTNSISSASSSATTADISSDWTDDDDDDDGDDNNEEKLKELSNNTNSDLVTADCATGFLIPNTNFGNLLQQNDDPLTDNIVASEDEYASAGDNEILTNGNSLNNVTIGTLTTTLPSDIVTNSTDNIRNNNNSFIEDSSFKSENDGTKKKLKSSKTPLKISNKIKYSLSTTPLTEQPSCSRMDITDSSDESEISRTITKQAQQQQSSIASTTTTTANSNLDTKSSCDSISKSSKSSTTSGCDDGAVSNISARKHEVKNGKHHRHHHHHHHHNRNCHHHHRHVSNTNTLIASSNSSSMTTTSSTDRSSTSTNSSENHKHHEYRHHSRKHKSKHQQSSTNNTHNNSVDCASSGDTTSSLSDGDPHEVDLALKAAGRMKFKSTENLLHRLFVCIAGVADQLQTNFASDLRQILRSVFFMNTTPVQEEIKIPEKSKDSTDLFEFRPSESDVIQENNAGSNQSIYSAAEEANPESDNVFMNDGSPNQSIDSGSNTSSNQEQQLQQHNRNNRHSERGNSLDSANSIVQHQTSRQQQQLNEYNNKNNPRNNIERTRSLGEECEENEQNTRKLHLLQERRRLSSQGSNSAGSESPVNSSASNSPVGERSIRTTNCFPNNDDTAIISTSAATIIGATAYAQPQPQPQQQQQITSNPINVVRRSTDRRSSTSQVLSHSTTNRRNANNNNNISTTSASLPKPSPPAWIPDEDAPRCMACTIPFTAFRRRHHCRNCGGVFCGGCSNSSAPLPKYGLTKAVRVCRDCYVREVGT